MSDQPQPVAMQRQFGTFTGVFTPTLLTILGVIMYVRLGWVVGNAGLMGALIIMGIAIGITICTGLSLASIATNTRIGHGGPYAVISKSLGLEVGGAVGIPLYLTRPLGVAMYIIGFREGIQWMVTALQAMGLTVLPTPPAIAIDLGVFALLFGIAYRSADLAFRVQYGIMAVIAASLVSIFASSAPLEYSGTIQWWGDYPGFPERGMGGATFWEVFAVFFPATTGILAGANMSGDLADPRRAIPQGALWAIGISTVIYGALAVWAAMSGSPAELAGNYNFIIDSSIYPPLVLAGLLGATFSSALAGLVGGPRILMAMGGHGILPRSAWLAKQDTDGEPRNAMAITGLLTFAALMMRELNVIAPLLTMFFLITYGVLNVVVLAEQSLGLVAFRPTLRIHWTIPAAGVIGCGFAMFVVNPTFAQIAIVVVIAVYVWILRLGVRGDGGDVRSSMFVAVAEWAAARVTELSHSHPRAWKPNLLIPVEDPARLRGEYQLLLDLARPEGTVKLLGLATVEPREELQPQIARLGRSLQDRDVFCRWSVIDNPSFEHGVGSALQSLQSAFFSPNLLVLQMSERQERWAELNSVIGNALETRVGVLLLALHDRAGIGQRKTINLWVRRPSESWDPERAFDSGNLNLILLMGYRLMRQWNAELHLITVVDDSEDVPHARRFLAELCDLTRLPPSVHRQVLVESFSEALRSAPQADLSILGLHRTEPDFAFVQDTVERTRCTCVFVFDSGRESALA